MIRLDYAALNRQPVANDPFPHVVVEHFVPSDELVSVVQDLPHMTHRGSFPTTSLRLGPMSLALIHELEGPVFRDAIASKFRLALDDAPTMVTLRGQSTDRDGQIHCDSTAKRVTVLLYLNPETEAWSRQEGCLRLLRSGADIENYVVEVPPINGSLLVFPNGPGTWHGHKRFIGQRYVVQLNYMTRDRAARSELRRHKVSAFLKRVTSMA